MVGLGFKPVEPKVKELFFKAVFVTGFKGSKKLVESLPFYENIKNKCKFFEKLEEVLSSISRFLESGDVVVIASGDPLYFGIGEILIKKFGKERVEIYPDLSSLQKGASILKLRWWEFKSLSFHGKDLSREELLTNLFTYKKLAVLTDPKNTPSKIAEFLLAEDVKVDFAVCERLGSGEERCGYYELKEAVKRRFEEPNIVFLVLEEKVKGYGLREEEFFTLKGMITKDEVRAVVLHKLRLYEAEVFWDVGAGSGAVSIEAVFLNPRLKVFAVERNPEMWEVIESNIRKFRAYQVRLVKGEAPECLKGLPQADRIFLGGSGGKLKEILEFLKGIKALKLILIAGVTLETVAEALRAFNSEKWNRSVSEVFVARETSLKSSRILKALNPIFLVTFEKRN